MGSGQWRDPRVVALLLLGMAGGCSKEASSGAPRDAAAPRDVAGRDAARDASRGSDAHAADAPRRPDAHDAPIPADAAPGADGPSPDAAPAVVLAPILPCQDPLAAIYATPPGLPPMTEAARGDIVACRNEGVLDVANAQGQLDSAGVVGVTAHTGVTILRLLYRTYRGNDGDGLSSARVYLPLGALAAPPPIVVAAHGTVGLADGCAISMDPNAMRDLALPFAARGYAVIAPDYAGLGTDGTQGYLDGVDTARSVIDAVAALRRLLPARALSRQVVVDGHSQGGGAALATQALARQAYRLDGELAAVIGFSPAYYSHENALGFVGALRSATTDNPLTITTGVSKCEVAMLIEYAFFASHVPGAQATAGFPATNADSIEGSIDTLCTVPLGGAIQAFAPHVADWTDATLRTALLACLDSRGMDAACTGNGRAFWQYLAANTLPPDPQGAPILYIQALQDTIMPADEEGACNVDVLRRAGLSPQVCADAAAIHTDVTQRNVGFAITWAEAILAGRAPPPCPTAAALPPCAAP